MSCGAKMRKLSVRIDADLKAAFEKTLRGIGVDPTCAMRSFAFQIVLEGDNPFGPVDAGFEASGGTAVTSVKIPEDVAGEEVADPHVTLATSLVQRASTAPPGGA